MDSNRWDKVQEILHRALDMTSTQRVEYLDSACDETAVRSEVDSLLEAHDVAGAYFDDLADRAIPTVATQPSEANGDSGAFDASDAGPPATMEGRMFGPYRLGELLGRGGMGAVYVAERADGQFEQTVALKLLPVGSAHPEAYDRFLEERRILARLEHAGIARLVDGGIGEDGTPFFAMEYVEGARVDRYADDKRLSVEDRLWLFLEICDAVSYAHRNLVVHRDLKPSNILVTPDGRAKLLDFGVAKVVQEGAEAAGTVTLPGHRMLTPAYASPEQLLNDKVTTASDVYALGVLLHELLTGVSPYALEPGDPGIIRAVCESAITSPSTRLSRTEEVEEENDEKPSIARIAETRGTSKTALAKRLRGDLDVIILKALRKEPERRYESVSELADDVRRHLAGFPVKARPESATYVASRFVQRHPFGTAAATAIVVLIALLVGTSVRFGVISSNQAREIAIERDNAVAVSSFLEDLFKAPDPYAAGPQRRDTVRIRDFISDAAEKARTDLDADPLVRAQLLGVLGNAFRNLGQFDEAEPLINEALELREANLPDNDPLIMKNSRDLALLLFDLGRFDEAEPLLRAAIAPGAEADTTVTANSRFMTYSSLGNVLQGKGEFDEAVTHYREALAIAQAEFEPPHQHTAAGLANLGTVLARQGHLRESEDLIRESLEINLQIFEDGHPRIASNRNNLAFVLSDLGEYDEAEDLYLAALAAVNDRFEGDHPQKARAFNNLGSLYWETDRIDEAEPMFRQAYEMRARLFGPDNPNTAVTQGNYASALRSQGQFEEALVQFGEALGNLEAGLGADHPRVAGVHANIAGTHHDLGDHRSSLESLQRSLEIRRVKLEEGHPTTAAVLSDIGRCHVELGELDAAEEALTEAMAMLEAHQDEQGDRWRTVLERVADLYERTGRDAEAAEVRSRIP